MDIPNLKLISQDGHEFFISRECAQHSGTLKTMLEDQPTEGIITIPIPGIPSKLLERTIDYMYYRQMYSRAPSQDAIPNFDVDPSNALELLLAAHYLDL
ncbi:transcription elongation factor B polypeptide, putative [Entamoeba invadens IP1]|uniref:Elongin-C n=1 Tax=Entamoeba invadens IP1 TaxID=370355 RepID=A0A0A1U1H1_ENTIV|nr:transcription elongation factor B polypeptide, putative [Entamoeba invadens IP1]ELP87889.1 transcription elongation factor B polypeptide, putative [Entamoeba invadens IP1]|eukprot:XP_004254660.1 transcription elongation factor B polypeptide, putative [Entamoeba invadens IP1]